MDKPPSPRNADRQSDPLVRSPSTRADRGLSDVVAIALLVAIVVGGAAVVATSGGRVLEDSRDRSDSMAAATTLDEIDARLTSLAAGAPADRTELVLGERRSDAFRIERSGSLAVSVDDGTCTATIPLTAIHYETRGGETLAYEAGGVWETGEHGTQLLTPPDIAYRNRTVQLSLVNLSGGFTGSRADAVRLESSVADTRAVERQLFANSTCLRLDAVGIIVTSDRHRAWGRYLADEFGLQVGEGVTVDEANGTAAVRLDETMLPAEADDDRNRVVDFAEGYVQYEDGNVSVDKGVDSNTYPVSISLLSGDTQGGRPTVAVHQTRQPIDVALVIDESGSMAEEGTTGATKLAETQNASKRFVGMLNASAGDRVGVVGYSDTRPCFWFDPCPPPYPEDARVHHGLTSDGDAVNATVGTSLSAAGWTPIAAGIDETTDLFVDQGADDRERVMVLLSDGQHNGDGNVTAAALRAAGNNVTIHTVGFGADADGELLRDVANRTGGKYYHAAGGVELQEQFEQIALEVSKSRAIETPPVTLKAGANTLLPNGSVRDVPPNGSAHNLNGPEVRRPLAYSMELRDGEALPVALADWNCDGWSQTNETLTGPDGYEYSKAWCQEAGTPNATVDPAGAPGRIRAFTGNDTTADLPSGTGSWVESNLTAILETNGLVAADGSLALDSNQVVLAYDLPDGPAGEGDFNDVVLLVEVGYATDEVSVRYAVDVTVSNVRVGASG